MRVLQSRLSSGTLALLSLWAGPALAQDAASAWPAKPVQVIIPFPPGGSTEAEGRLYAQKLTDNLGRAFILDFKPGAATTIGTAYVARAVPDGHTLLASTTSYSLASVFYKDLPYDALKDIAPISMMTRRPSVLLVTPSLPVKTPAEYIAYARSHPGELNYATTGAGGSPHIGGAWLHSAGNIKVTYVHYKGSGPLMVDLLAGRVHSNITTFLTALPLHKSGKVRIIGVTTLERSALMPELPTMAEGGAPGFDHSSWWGFMTAGGTPVAVVNRIRTELVKVGNAPDVVKKMTEDGAVMTLGTPEQFRQSIAADLVRLRRLVQDNGIKPEE